MAKIYQNGVNIGSNRQSTILQMLASAYKTRQSTMHIKCDIIYDQKLSEFSVDVNIHLIPNFSSTGASKWIYWLLSWPHPWKKVSGSVINYEYAFMIETQTSWCIIFLIYINWRGPVSLTNLCSQFKFDWNYAYWNSVIGHQTVAKFCPCYDSIVEICEIDLGLSSHSAITLYVPIVYPKNHWPC